MTGHSAKIISLSKQYKIMGVPLDAAHTDQLFNEFKLINVQLLRLNPPSGKKDLRSALSPCSFSSPDIKNGGLLYYVVFK